jgi:hypothetical protein
MNPLRQGCALMAGLCCSLGVARGQYSFPAQNPVSSVSGQFVVSSVASDAPAAPLPGLAADTNVVRLNTELLAVAAERFKLSLWRELGIPSDSTWSGRIFLEVHPARSLDETVTIASSSFLDHWNYTLELPDALRKMRYARALSGVLLLELSNRSAAPGGHSAEVPPWLVDGLARQVIATAGDEVVLSVPGGKADELRVGRINEARRSFDTLADARAVLQAAPALTFDELSWPTDDQMNGADGGIYSASSHLFVASLLELKNGRGKMRAFLAELPAHFNWQMSFFAAFAEDFKGPLDVEKWWALRVVNFAARAPGPRWTADVSLARLDALLSVPVDFRNDSNALPAHAEISLQDAVENLTPEQREAVLEVKLRDLALEELRLAPPFGGLADAYRVALADFLGESKPGARATATSKHGVPMNRTASLEETVKVLNSLDRRRRAAETESVFTLQNPRRLTP